MPNVSSAARTAGKIHRTVEVAGKKFLLSQTPPLGMIGEIEAWILGQRVDLGPIAIRWAKQAPPEMQGLIIKSAALATVELGTTPTAKEWDRFDRSLWRPAFMFWKMLDAKHAAELPDVEAVYKLFQADANDVDELVAMVKGVANEDALKNSNGPSAP